jgi:Nse1 non-SMC component of SMC5-6 complex
MLDRIKGDFADAQVDAPLEDTFKRMNNALRKCSMEIRSVRQKDDEGRWEVFYGLVNTEEDFVAKEYGIKGAFEDGELRFFSNKLLPKLVSNKYLTTGEVNELVSKGNSLSKSKVHDLLVRLLKRQGVLGARPSNFSRAARAHRVDDQGWR